MSGEMPEIDADFDEIEDIPFALDQFITEQPDGSFRVEVEIGGRQNTVELRDVYRFEEDLVDELIEEKTEKYRRGANIPVKGPWIHGWLEENGEDYISSIFKNYQFFLKFVEGRTATIENKGTVQRAPGTYDSMYTYLMVLEKLDLVERFKREEIPDGEFDHPVPDEFQDRAYLRVTTSLSEAPDKWRNPFKANYPDLYGDGDGEESEDVSEEMDQVEEEVESSVDEEPDDDVEDDDSKTDLSDISRIDEFGNPGGFADLIDGQFKTVVSEVLDNPPAPRASEGLSADDFVLGDVIMYGEWVEGNASAGQDGANIVFEVIPSGADRSPQFVPLGTANTIERRLNTDNPVPEVFTSYTIDASYNSNFFETVTQILKDLGNSKYYSVVNEEFGEV